MKRGSLIKSLEFNQLSKQQLYWKPAVDTGAANQVHVFMWLRQAA